MTPPKYDIPAALLSYLLPGLGQVLQGRVGKGVLFFVCLYSLFFYGVALGQRKNVWLPDVKPLPRVSLPLVGELGGVAKSVYYRPQFLGQFWIGAAAWPAVAQFYLTKSPVGDAPAAPSPVLGHYMQAPLESELNEINRDGPKLRVELAWVYTVIAGALNVLVIYDALAGPAVRTPLKKLEVPTTPAIAGGV